MRLASSSTHGNILQLGDCWYTVSVVRFILRHSVVYKLPAFSAHTAVPWTCTSAVICYHAAEMS